MPVERGNTHGFLIKNSIDNSKQYEEYKAHFLNFYIRKKIVSDELSYKKKQIVNFVEAVSMMPDHRDNRGKKKIFIQPSSSLELF
ncbi:MAG: hypothetical protein D3923_19670 [Candidatus Electrothrix sp. AR3]|nr:hypothetical protein [Candidatus Electrothrix sp. AR3]